MLHRLVRHSKKILLRALEPKDDFIEDIAVPTNRLGSDYGGWTICSAHLGKSSVVYSFGVGEDISFDLALAEKYGVEVHLFDPTPRSLAWLGAQTLPPQLHVHNFGLAAHDGILKVYPPVDPTHVSLSIVPRGNTQGTPELIRVKRLKTVLESLGHERIDILKMDIEGAEYDVIDDILGGAFPVRQLLVEFHHRFPEFGLKKTSRAIRALRRHGFDLFAISPSREEFSFLHRD